VGSATIITWRWWARRVSGSRGWLALSATRPAARAFRCSYKRASRLFTDLAQALNAEQRRRTYCNDILLKTDGIGRIQKVHRACPTLNRSPPPPGDQAPNEQDNYRAHDGSYEPGTLIDAVPADSLPQILATKAPTIPSSVVRANPDGSLSPGVINFAITPAIHPMMIVQMMCMGRPAQA
jgi:hypothetical protein